MCYPRTSEKNLVRDSEGSLDFNDEFSSGSLDGRWRWRNLPQSESDVEVGLAQRLEPENCQINRGNSSPYTPSWGNFELVRDVIDDVVLVPEEEIEVAIRLLSVENKLVAEGNVISCLNFGFRAFLKCSNDRSS